MAFARSHSLILHLPCGAGAAMLAVAAFAQPSITNIGVPPGGSASYAHAVSSNGLAVCGHFTSGQARAFRWTRETGMLDLGTLPNEDSYGTAISADGTTVVGFAGQVTTPHAFRWTELTGVQDLNQLLGATWSLANAVDADGTVVVGGYSSALGSRSYRWSVSGGPQDLGVLPGSYSSSASGVSADGGVVVGSSGSVAYRWQANSGIVDLGIPSQGTYSECNAISADGRAATGSCFVSGEKHLIRWSASRGVEDLGTPPGSIGASGNAISANGAIIVGTISPAPQGARAMLWTEALGIVDLNTYLPSLGVELSDWYLYEALAISPDGTAIVGNGIYLGDPPNLLTRGFLVTGLNVPTCYADCDGSAATPVLSTGDFVCFLAKFRAGDAYANCDGSTGSPALTAADFVCFLGKFRAGCP